MTFIPFCWHWGPKKSLYWGISLASSMVLYSSLPVNCQSATEPQSQCFLYCLYGINQSVSQLFPNFLLNSRERTQSWLFSFGSELHFYSFQTVMAPNGRFKRKARKKSHALSKSEIKYLSENTNFKQEAIIEWHKV